MTLVFLVIIDVVLLIVSFLKIGGYAMFILLLILFLAAVGILYSVLIVGKRADEKKQILMDKSFSEVKEKI